MDPKRKIYISIISFSIISALIIVFILIPLLNNIKKYSDDLVSQKKELALLQKEIEIFNETRSIFKGYQENSSKIDKLFYNPDDPLDFLSFLTKKPESYGVRNEIQKMSSNTGDQSSVWPSISFQVSSTGSFSNLMKFFKNLESGPYLIEISNMSIKKLSDSELQVEKSKGFSTADTNATLLLKVYSK